VHPGHAGEADGTDLDAGGLVRESGLKSCRVAKPAGRIIGRLFRWRGVSQNMAESDRVVELLTQILEQLRLSRDESAKMHAENKELYADSCRQSAELQEKSQVEWRADAQTARAEMKAAQKRANDSWMGYLMALVIVMAGAIVMLAFRS
jgi:hypothetical protein